MSPILERPRRPLVKTSANLTEGRIVRTFAFLPRRMAFLPRAGVGRLAPLGGAWGQSARRGTTPGHLGRMCYWRIPMYVSGIVRDGGRSHGRPVAEPRDPLQLRVKVMACARQ